MAEGSQRPTIGCVVMYVLPAGAHAGRVRKADVVDVLSLPDDAPVCELIVALASGDLARSPDGDSALAAAVLRDSAGGALFMRVVAPEGGAEELGTWFWPKRTT